MKQKRVVITGTGIISPLGLDPDTFTQNLKDSVSGIGKVSIFNTEAFRSSFGAELRNFNAAEFLDPEVIARWNDPYLLFALAAAEQTLIRAGLPLKSGFSRRFGIVTATCNGSARLSEILYDAILSHRIPKFTPAQYNLLRDFTMGQALASTFEIGGPVSVVTTACSSSTAAVGMAFDLIQTDRADIVLTGGADALCLTAYAGFNGIKAMCPEKCSPFSSKNIGMTLGEGAAYWILESESHAVARNVDILGEVCGYSLSSDAYHPTSPDPRGGGAYTAMARAVERSGIPVSDIEYISAHGTGTEANDVSETRAFTRLLADQTNSVPVSSSKSYFGHCLGAAGILEMSAALFGMQNGFIPATLNFDQPRPGCSLDYVPNHIRNKKISVFLKNNMAFGGNNAAVVVREHTPGQVHSKATTDAAARRVFIRGSSAVCGLGHTPDTILGQLFDNKTAIAPVQRFNTAECRSRYAGLVPELDWRKVAPRSKLTNLQRICRYALLATKQALESAGQRISKREGRKTGIITGLCLGPGEEKLMHSIWGSSEHVPDLASFSYSVPNSIAGYVARELYLTGFNSVLSNGPQAGLAALIQAEDSIRLDHCDNIVACASDEIYQQYFFNYDRAGFLVCGGDESRIRSPWVDYDVIENKPGIILGEGAAAILLSSDDQQTAYAKGTRVEILGSDRTMSAGMFSGSPDDTQGILTAVTTALKRGNTAAEEIDLILTASPTDVDRVREKSVLKKIFKCDIPPTLTTTHATGFLEAGSSLLTLALAISPQGLEMLSHLLRKSIRRFMILGTSSAGYNYVLILEVLHQ